MKDGCVPCQIVGNMLDDRNIQYEVINILEHDDLREKYSIQGVPVLILLNDDGVEIDRVSGFNPLKIESLLSKLN